MGPFTAAEAAKMLSLDGPRASRLLRYLAGRGWLARVRVGLYALVPLGASRPSEWREDAWVVATKAFEPCYIGGWSAAEHWGLTEQIFRDIVVMTARPVRRRQLEIQGTLFRLKRVPKRQHFGTRTVWRERVRVLVSDPMRTLVDVLDDPALGGGIRQVASVLAAGFEGEHRDESRLIEYARRRGNRTVFKRLGYLLETLGIKGPDLIAACLAAKSAGLTKLDPTVQIKGRVVKRWNLRVNVEIRPTEPLT